MYDSDSAQTEVYENPWQKEGQEFKVTQRRGTKDFRVGQTCILKDHKKVSKKKKKCCG